MRIKPLPVEKLARRCDPRQFGFASTADLDDAPAMFGQDRAKAAIHFGTDIGHAGYNLFVLGPAGSGKHIAAERFLRDLAAKAPAANDWVYVNNFDDPQKPKALRIKAGLGRALKQALHKLVDDLSAAIPALFESDAYRARRSAIDDAANERRQEAFDAVRRDAEAEGLGIVRAGQGIAIVPLQDGQPMPQEAFRRLDEATREAVIGRIRHYEQRLSELMKQIPRWERDRHEKLAALDRETASAAVDQFLAPLLRTFASDEKLAAHLRTMRDDMIENAGIFGEMMEGEARGHHASPQARYGVNLFVDNGESKGAPVVIEHNPHFANLVGRIEHLPVMGMMLTDYTMVRAGALHKANGGFLMLDAQEVLMQPLAWDALKRMLRERRVKIEDPRETMGLATIVNLEPEPVPLDVKVVLFGPRWLYYLLAEAEPDFADLFKVKADFNEAVDRTDDSVRVFAGQLASMVRRKGLRHLDPGGVARCVEQASRIADDSSKMTLMHQPLSDLLAESDYWAAKAGRKLIGAGDVEKAVAAMTDRASRSKELYREYVGRGVLVVETEGARVGQINGLSVVGAGGFYFGRPIRISARVRHGTGQVIDIERLVSFGGPIHSKGVLILTGYLNAHYAIDRPISLAASIAVEQSYGDIDGDSASAAELFAILSAIADVPLKQTLAVTGSVDQNGHVQAIGGVNEKIEGFFDLCVQRGLNGRHGVVIPKSNVGDLMLKAEVLDAVKAGKFSVTAIETIDEGLELFTGQTAGRRKARGFPVGTFNARVARRLQDFAKQTELSRRTKGWWWF